LRYILWKEKAEVGRYTSTGTGLAIVIGVIVLAFSVFMVYVSTWILFAFGVLVDSNQEIARNTAGLRALKNAINKSNTSSGATPSAEINAALAAKIEKTSSIAPIIVTERDRKQDVKVNLNVEELDEKVICTNCSADLSFMGFKEEDMDESQKCPFCDKELIKK